METKLIKVVLDYNKLSSEGVEAASIHVAAEDQLDFRFFKIQKELEQKLNDIRAKYKRIKTVTVELELETE